MESRSGFVFYEGYYKILKALPPSECQELMGLICNYALYGNAPSSFPNELIEGIWFMFCKSLQRGRTNMQNAAKSNDKGQKTASAQSKLPEQAEPVNDNKPEPTQTVNKLIEAKPEFDFEEEDPGREYTFDELTPTEKMQELKDREDLEKMGIIVDCCVGEVEPSDLIKPFAESEFLRNTFKTLSKIKRHYKKIIAGCYKTVRPSPPTSQDDYMKHNYSPDRLKDALVKFDEWDDDI